MLNSCKNSIKILKIACIHKGTVANEGITKNALLDQKIDIFFHTNENEINMPSDTIFSNFPNLAH